MLRLISIFLLFTFLSSVIAIGQTGDKTAKLQAAAQKLAADADTADVTLISGTKRRGRLSGVLADAFTLTAENATTSETIAFANVEKISKHKRGLSKSAWVAIIGGAAGAIIITAVLRSIYCNEQAC